MCKHVLKAEQQILNNNTIIFCTLMYVNHLRQQALLYGIFLLDELEDTDMCAVFFFFFFFFGS